MKIGIVLLVSLFWIIIACSPKPMAESVTQEVPKSASVKVEKEGWEAEWDNLVKEARKEGKVVIFTSAGGPTPGAISQGFKNRLGIDAEITSGTGRILAQKIISERRAGLYTVDIHTSGYSGVVLDMKPHGILEYLPLHLILPEVKEGKYWYEGKHRWVDKDKTIFNSWLYPSGQLIANKELVRADELSSLKELLAPRWKGKIVMYDPTLPGSGIAWFFPTESVLGTDFMRNLARQEPTILGDHRLIVDWLARGKFAIGIGASKEVTADFINAGAPLRIHSAPRDAAYVAGGSGAISMIKNAPHPAAAKVFMNWYLSREGQLISSRAQGVQSAREDLPIDHLPPDSVRQPDVKYIDQITEEAVPARDEAMKLAREIFGHLMR